MSYQSITESGFSLIELLVTLTILGLLFVYGMCSMTMSYRKNALQKTADEIKLAVHFAKIEALTKEHTVTLAPLSKEGGWSTGMRLFVDNNKHDYNKESVLIRIWSWHDKAIHVSWNGFESTHYLRFSPSLSERTANGSFMIQDDAHHEIKLVVNRLGRIDQRP